MIAFRGVPTDGEDALRRQLVPEGGEWCGAVSVCEDGALCGVEGAVQSEGCVVVGEGGGC